MRVQVSLESIVCVENAIQFPIADRWRDNALLLIHSRRRHTGMDVVFKTDIVVGLLERQSLGVYCTIVLTHRYD